MSSGLIATKVGMSRIFSENGQAVAVTYLKLETNTIVRIKTAEKDGYNALVLGTCPVLKKTRKGTELRKYKNQKEWKTENVNDQKKGDAVVPADFTCDSMVTVIGVSKGKGFQGVIKRHNFSSGPETHGSHHHRRPGSVGMRELPGRVLKGKKLPGRQGGKKVTLHRRPVLVSDLEKGILGIKGAVPGPNGAVVYLTLETSPKS